MAEKTDAGSAAQQSAQTDPAKQPAAGEQQQQQTQIITPAQAQAAAAQGAQQAQAGAGDKQPDGKEDPEGPSPKPDARNMITLPSREFKERVAKESRKSLRELFGTSDPEAIRAIKKKYDEWEKGQEEHRKEQLSKEQRLAEERDEATRRADKATARAERERDRVRNYRLERKLRGIAAEHVHPDKVDRALDLMQSTVVNMSRKDARRLGTTWAAEWLKKLSEDAYFAKGGAAAPAKEKEPITNGATGKPHETAKASAAGGDLWKGKTPRPGQPNSMTPQELRQWATENKLPLP